MTAAFIITLELSELSPDALANAAEDLFEAAEGAGHDVVDVKPWARPSLQPPGIVPPTLSDGIPPFA